MTQDTRTGTDASTAAKILGGLRERITRLEKRDRHTEDFAHLLRVASENTKADDLVTIEATTGAPPSDGFGLTPFGSTFGDPAAADTQSAPGELVDTDTDDEEFTVTHYSEVSNTTTVGYHSYVADYTDPDGPSPARPDSVAIGTSGGPFDETNEALGDRVGSVELINTTRVDGGTTTVFSANIGQSELNGNTLRELALINDETGRMFNHAPISPSIEKTNDTQVTIEIRISIVDR